LATIGATAPLAVAVVEAIQDGDLARLWRLLDEHPGLATARIGDEGPGGMSRDLLHWAASSNDVAVLDDGADIEVFGGVIGGTPLADARAFAQWEAAHRLVARGARTTVVDAATLGLLDRLEGFFTGPEPPTPEVVSVAFWGACHGGQQPCAAWLLDRGAELNWIPPWEDLTPLDAAERRGTEELVAWLRDRGASSAAELHAT
jgi:hypothetical protein